MLTNGGLIHSNAKTKMFNIGADIGEARAGSEMNFEMKFFKVLFK